MPLLTPLSIKMLKNVLRSFFIILILVTTYMAGCSDNPFFSDEPTYDTRVLRGKVLLSDGANPGNVYIWLEELDITARTDASGSFRLAIPRNDELNGFNQNLKLYYYAGNYAIEYSNVLVIDGKFEYGKYAINNQGYISSDIILIKQMEIATIVQPEVVNTNLSGSVSIDVTVTNLDTNLLVINRMTRDKILSGFIFREINSGPETAQRFDLDNVVYTGRYLNEPVTWNGTFAWPTNLLAPGTYEVYPYIFLRQEEIPPELLNSFGNRADEFNQNYLKIPFKQTTARLTIN